ACRHFGPGTNRTPVHRLAVTGDFRWGCGLLGSAGADGQEKNRDEESQAHGASGEKGVAARCNLPTVLGRRGPAREEHNLDQRWQQAAGGWVVWQATQRSCNRRTNLSPDQTSVTAQTFTSTTL